MSNSGREHPETAQLLACVDGELNPLRTWILRRHISRCWPCRGKIASFEDAIRDLGAELTAPPLPPGELGRAKWRWRSAAAAWEAGAAVRECRSPWRRRIGYAAGVTVAIAALYVARPAPPQASPPARPASIAAEMLSRTIRSEAPPAPTAIRQDSFTVEMQTRGRPPVRRNWQLWAAPQQGLDASHWQDASGRLRNAVFASERSESAVYNSGRGLRPAVLRHESRHQWLLQGAIEADRDSKAMEEYVLSWIQQQVWEPVSLAREVAEFCSRNGASLRLSQRGELLRWEAQVQVAGRAVRIVLEAPEGSAPRLMEMNWQSSGRESKLHLDRTGTQTGMDQRLAAAYLHPNAGLTRLPPQPAKESKSIPEPLSAAAELQVLGAVHQARLCGTDAVQVVSGADGVHLAAPSASSAQREQILSLIKDLSNAGLVHVQFGAVAAGDRLSAGPAVTVAGGTAHPALAEGWLRERLRVGKGTNERDMFDLMNVLVRESEQLTAASWAIKQLAEHFPASREQLLDGFSRSQLHVLAADHADDMARSLATINAVLTSLDVRHAEAPATPASSGHWQGAVQNVDVLARRCSDMLLAFFAGGESAAGSAIAPDRSELPPLLAELRGTLARLRQSLAAF